MRSLCLCLICRQSGHAVRECPYLNLGTRKYGGIKLPDDLEHARRSAALLNPRSPGSSQPRELCHRCRNPHILQAFTASPPLTAYDTAADARHADSAKKKVLAMHELGSVFDIKLLSTCPLCCMLFDITHLSEDTLINITIDYRDDDRILILVPAWTSNRIERDLKWSGYQKGKGPYAKCLYTTVKPLVPDWSWGTELVDTALDAIAIEDANGKQALSVRRVDPQAVDYTAVLGWLEKCARLHRVTCGPIWSEDLRKIRLVDVGTRKIVAYPPDRCDFLALSYVWGGVKQPGFAIGATLPKVPETIEDAMLVTHKLGKRYIWVDSLCINQDDMADIAAQIPLMCAIYTGAWATVIALSGQSAHSGLPRVGSIQGIIPQLGFEISGKRLLSTMPKLSFQIEQSPWVGRAWTYQEGMLSSRRIIFTPHQVYFECNTFQCCESLDSANSPLHNLTDMQHLAELPKPDTSSSEERPFGPGVLKDPFRAFPTEQGKKRRGDDPLERYMHLVNTYTSRKMSNDSDAINAFGAMLTRLSETDFKSGFILGLPLEELPRALLWAHDSVNPGRRKGFPEWTWAGWIGTVLPSVINPVPEKKLQPPLRIWNSSTAGSPELVYEFNPIHWQPQTKRKKVPNKSTRGGAFGISKIAAILKGETGDSSKNQVVSPGGSVFQPDDDAESVSDDSSDYSTETLSDSEFEGELDPVPKTDPILDVAKNMFETDPILPQRIDSGPLLVEGIIIQLQFKIDKDGQCEVRLRGSSRQYTILFYGGDEKRIIKERQGSVQSYLLLARDRTVPRVVDLQNSMLMVDWVGDAARRVIVASLEVDWYQPGLLACTNPQRRLFSLL